MQGLKSFNGDLGCKRPNLVFFPRDQLPLSTWPLKHRFHQVPIPPPFPRRWKEDPGPSFTYLTPHPLPLRRSPPRCKGFPIAACRAEDRIGCPLFYRYLPQSFLKILLLRKPSKTQGKQPVLKRKMVRKKGESTPRFMGPFPVS